MIKFIPGETYQCKYCGKKLIYTSSGKWYRQVGDQFVLDNPNCGRTGDQGMKLIIAIGDNSRTSDVTQEEEA